MLLVHIWLLLLFLKLLPALLLTIKASMLRLASSGSSTFICKALLLWMHLTRHNPAKADGVENRSCCVCYCACDAWVLSTSLQPQHILFNFTGLLQAAVFASAASTNGNTRMPLPQLELFHSMTMTTVCLPESCCSPASLQCLLQQITVRGIASSTYTNHVVIRGTPARLNFIHSL